MSWRRLIDFRGEKPEIDSPRLLVVIVGATGLFSVLSALVDPMVTLSVD